VQKAIERFFLVAVLCGSSFLFGCYLGMAAGRERADALASEHAAATAASDAELAGLRGQLADSAAVGKRLGDGLRSAVDRASKVASYRGRVDALLDGIGGALVEAGILADGGTGSGPEGAGISPP